MDIREVKSARFERGENQETKLMSIDINFDL